MARKKSLETTILETSASIIIDHDAEAALREALNGGERTKQVVDITRRALTLRAKGATPAEIAQSERVEKSTLSQWLASPRRAPTPAEAKRIMDEEIKPLAAENAMHMLLAGNEAMTRQVMKDSGVVKPAKSAPSQTSIVVGVGTAPIGKDPASV